MHFPEDLAMASCRDCRDLDGVSIGSDGLPHLGLLELNRGA